MKVAVLGGGISGLSCAYYLLKHGAEKLSQVLLVEASNRVGGWIDTKRFDDGVIFELGPKSIRPVGINGKNTLLLADELGLRDEIIYFARGDSAAKKRFIWYNNQMNMLPSSLVSLFKTNPPFEKPFFKYLLNDLTTAKIPISDEEDISFYDLMHKRFGEDVAKFMADPLCRGITAGDARKLSVKSLFPQIYEAERSHGSVIKGIMLSAPKYQEYKAEVESNSLVQRSRKERWASWSLKKGLSQLPETLLDKLETFRPKFNNMVGYKCDHIMYKDDGTAVMHVSNSNSIRPTSVDHIISTLPGPQLAKCISSKKYPDICQSLKTSRHVPVGVVCLEYQGSLLPKDQGFGFLTPSFGDQPILGIVYDSCAFPHHNAGKDITRLTVMMGGEWFEELFGDPSSVSSERMLQTALKAVHSCLKITQDPIRNTVAIHKDCIPQYYLGHEANLKKISRLINEHKINLQFTGFSFYGVGVNDNILNARRTAESFLANK